MPPAKLRRHRHGLLKSVGELGRSRMLTWIAVEPQRDLNIGGHHHCVEQYDPEELKPT